MNPLKMPCPNNSTSSNYWCDWAMPDCMNYWGHDTTPVKIKRLESIVKRLHNMRPTKYTRGE